MKKRFKSHKKKKLISSNTFLIILVIIISIYTTYNIIYNLYISKLSNKEIITHIINNTKNNKYNNSIINDYLNPKSIIKNNFILKEQESIKVDNQLTKLPIIYIYNTHETESYQDKYLELYNIKPTVKTMSLILQDYLLDYNIPTIVEDTSITDILRSNNWSYKYSYKASRLAIEDKIKETPSLKLIIDLHRDSSKLEKTILEYNDKTYAKILFVVGKEHNNYEENHNISKILQVLLEEEIPGITRGITLKEGTGVNGIYNQDLSPKSILIELGGQYNEIEQLNNTIEILAKVILKYTERTI